MGRKGWRMCVEERNMLMVGMGKGMMDRDEGGLLLGGLKDGEVKYGKEWKVIVVG